MKAINLVFISIFLSVCFITPVYSAPTQEQASRQPANPEQRYATHVQQVEKRLDNFKHELQITSNQERAWDIYTAAVRDNMTDLHTQMLAEIQHPPQSATEHFMQIITLKQTALKDLENVSNSFNILYAALSAEQRALADKHFEKIREKIMEHFAKEQ